MAEQPRQHAKPGPKAPGTPATEAKTEMAAPVETPPAKVEFDFSAWPENTLFYERRTQNLGAPAAPSGGKKERRRRVDPCTFEKQYTPEETEFMNAMQQFKVQTGKTFPTHGDVLNIAHKLGYRKSDDPDEEQAEG